MAGRTASGVACGTASRLLSQVVQLASVAVLARLVAPADFGLVAIVTTFVGFAMIFTNLGIGAFLVHAREPSPDDLSTAFWLNAASGLLLTAVFTAASGPIADLYGQPRLGMLVAIGSLSFSLSLGIVHNALLERDLRFTSLALVEPSAILVSAVVPVSLAAAGAGATALVVGHVAATVWKTGCLWSMVRWLPRARPSTRSLRDLWSYSGALFGFNVVNYWARNADNLLLGAVAGPGPLAFYSRAYALMLLPVQQGTQVLGRVLFPALTRMREDEDRLRRGYVRSLRLLAALTFPLSVGMASASPALVSVVLGGRWSDAAVLLAVLSLSGPAQIVSGTTGALYQAVGRSDLQLRRGLVSAVVLVSAIVLGLRWGAVGVAIAVSTAYWAVAPVVTAPAWRLVGLRSSTALRLLLPLAACAAAMGGAVLAVGELLHDSSGPPGAAVLLVQVGTGAATYAVLLRLLARDVWYELLGLVVRTARRPRLAFAPPNPRPH